MFPKQYLTNANGKIDEGSVSFGMPAMRDYLNLSKDGEHTSLVDTLQLDIAFKVRAAIRSRASIRSTRVSRSDTAAVRNSSSSRAPCARASEMSWPTSSPTSRLRRASCAPARQAAQLLSRREYWRDFRCQFIHFSQAPTTPPSAPR